MRALIAGVALLLFATPTEASRAVDGSWSVEVLTERGDCEPVYRYYLVIANGAVHVKSMSGEVSPDPAGRIGPMGKIDTRIGSADDPVTIRGRLEGNGGAGTWIASARRCAGRWQAEKRG